MGGFLVANILTEILTEKRRGFCQSFFQCLGGPFGLLRAPCESPAPATAPDFAIDGSSTCIKLIHTNTNCTPEQFVKRDDALLASCSDKSHSRKTSLLEIEPSKLLSNKAPEHITLYYVTCLREDLRLGFKSTGCCLEKLGAYR